jgi:hypothetical protein
MKVSQVMNVTVQAEPVRAIYRTRLPAGRALEGRSVITDRDQTMALATETYNFSLEIEVRYNV